MPDSQTCGGQDGPGVMVKLGLSLKDTIPLQQLALRWPAPPPRLRVVMVATLGLPGVWATLPRRLISEGGAAQVFSLASPVLACFGPKCRKFLP